MDSQRIIHWLRGHAKSQAALNLLGGAGMLLVGFGILAATWAFMYMVSLFVLGRWLGYGHWVHWAAGLIVIPILFWGNATTSREYLSEYSVTVGTAFDQPVTFFLPGVGIVSNVNPLAPDTMHTGVKMITDCLYFGPRIVVMSLEMLRKSFRLARLDVEGCGAVIATLLATGRKMSFQEIVERIDGVNPVRIFPQLRDIRGVVFLSSEPAGLKLSQELRETLQKIL